MNRQHLFFIGLVSATLHATDMSATLKAYFGAGVRYFPCNVNLRVNGEKIYAAVRNKAKRSELVLLGVRGAEKTVTDDKRIKLSRACDQAKLKIICEKDRIRISEEGSRAITLIRTPTGFQEQ